MRRLMKAGENYGVSIDGAVDTVEVRLKTPLGQRRAIREG